ncbi:MAG: FIST N-terminal domain-containing protein [Thiothrix sp.]|uniref:FIST signal transduction protein n=1 Tax=Thiothrix sp. TaxID=1032 RepID=UPI00262B3390|nr:FIST N-terminal domain-containing protein [Thiothrix sp.]MDD5395604.1 FIST N-terminal domain-containing protein [Thiothrix sp.]
MKISTLTYTVAHGFSSVLPDISSPQLLILIFGHSDFLEHTHPFEVLAEKYPQATFMGCSSAGEILGKHIHDNSLVIALAQFESSRLHMTHIAIDGAQDSHHAGRVLADRLTGDDLKGIFVLSDGLNVNGSELVQGFNDVVAGITVTGGLAGDGKHFKKTWVLKDGKPTSHTIAALGLYGDVKIGHGSKGGWKPFGPAREVTRAEHNVLYELAGKPALSLYKTYLGEMAEGLPATGLRFSLALSQPGETKELVRTILAVDEATQSLTFAGDIPVGAYAQLMRANLEQLVEGAEDAALMSATKTDAEVLCIAISCVGRRMVMGVDAEEEAEAVLDILPESTQQIGFYSYGEISPYAKGSCDLHNQTMTLTTLYE